jgi:uncharacterized protein YkwD
MKAKLIFDMLEGEGGGVLRFFKGLLVGLILSIVLQLWIFGWGDWNQALQKKWLEIAHSSDLEEVNKPLQHEAPLKKMPEVNLPEQGSSAAVEDKDVVITNEDTSEPSVEGIYIGMSLDDVKESLGEPSRIEPSAYGYQWWVYNQDWRQYIQVGIDEEKVVTLYTNAPRWGWSHFVPGMPSEDWQKHWTGKQEISFHYDLGFYTLTLSETDLKERPLAIDGNTAIQLYIDVHDENKISGLRLMDFKTLLLHRPYALKYIGTLPEPPSLSAQEEKQVAEANEKQIFDIVNITRRWHQLSPFQWHDDVAIVAQGHSQDMFENDFFDHISPSRGDLGKRLEQIPVLYQTAGENIAWNYIDSADAHEGWLNSLGHRKNVMKGEFTHLGVGVVHKYYTQNFITP